MAEHTAEVDVTPAQRREIERQAAYYDSDECRRSSECAGLRSYRIYDPRELWGGDPGGRGTGTPSKGYPEGSVAVDFTYIYKDEGFGLETTVWSPNGVCVDSQDFG